MKTMLPILMLLISVPLTWAQEPPPDRQRPESRDRRPEQVRPDKEGRERPRRPGPEMDRRPPRGRGEHGGHAARGPSVDRWLNRLKSEEPEAFEQLMALKESDPKAFREAVRLRLNRDRVVRSLRDFPTIVTAIDELPPTESKRFWERIGRLQMLSRGLEGRREGHGSPSTKEFEKYTKLKTAYAEADTDEKRDQIRKKARMLFKKKVASLTQQREEHLKRMEADLARVKESLKANEGNQDEWVDRMLERFFSEE
jgi:hypothetical protein